MIFLPHARGCLAAASWTPAKATSAGSFLPSAWWKADSLSQSDDTDVTSWSDSSGNGCTLTSVDAAKSPHFRTAQINSLPALQFASASSQHLTGGDILDINAGGITAFVVAKRNSGDCTLFSKSRAAPELGRYYAGHYASSFGGYVASYLNAAGTETPAGAKASTSTSAVLWAFQIARTCAAFTRLNGVAGTTGTSAANATDYNTADIFLVGAYPNVGGTAAASSYWNGLIAEIVFYKAVLSSDDILQVESYLNRRYSLY